MYTVQIPAWHVNFPSLCLCVQKPLKKRQLLERHDSFDQDEPEPVYEIVSAPVEEIYMTIANFNAEKVGDGLSFDAGVAVSVVTKNPNGWWYVEIKDREGWVPSSYLEKRQQSVSPVHKTPVSPTSPVGPKPSSSSGWKSSAPPLPPKSTSTVAAPSKRPLAAAKSIPVLPPKGTSSSSAKPLPLTPSGHAKSSALSERAKPRVPERRESLDASKLPDDFSSRRKGSLVRSTSSDKIYEKTTFNLSGVVRSRSPPPKSHASSVRTVIASKPAQQPGVAAKPAAPTRSFPDKRSRPRPPERKQPPPVEKPAPYASRKPTNELPGTRTGSMVRSTSSDKIYERPNVKPSNVSRSRSPPHSSSSRPVIASSPIQRTGIGTKPAAPTRPKPFVPVATSNKSPPEARSLRFGASLDEMRLGKSSSSNPWTTPQRTPVSKTLSSGVSPQPSHRTLTPRTHEPRMPSVPSRSRVNPPSRQAGGGGDSTDGPAHHRRELERTLRQQSGTASHDGSSAGASHRTMPGRPLAAAAAAAAPPSTGKRAPPKRPPPPKAGARKSATPRRPTNSPAVRRKTTTHVTVSGYDGSGEGCLSFARGEHVQVLERSSDGWWFVRIGDREGWAPSTYMDECEETAKPARAASSSSTLGPAQATPQQTPLQLSPKPKPRTRTKSASTMYRALAMYTAPLRDDHGMDLVEGRLYEVLEKSEDGWWFVKDGDREGWAPSTYLEAP